MNRIAPSPIVSEMAAELPILNAAIRHPLPLFITAVAAVWAGSHTGQNVPLTYSYTLFAYLLSLMAVIDLKHGILPHTLTGLLAILGTLLAPTLGLTYWDSSLGALIAFSGLFTCAFITGILTGKPSLGGGDLWLALALGAWVGISGLPMLLMATAVTGILSVLLKRWLTHFLHAGYYPAGQGSGGPGSFPFGPALCAAGWLALLYAPAYWKFIEMLVPSAS